MHIRFIFAYAKAEIGTMSEMKRQQTQEKERRLGSRYVSTLTISASLIAAVRLPKAVPNNLDRRSEIYDCVDLARAVLQEVLRRYPYACDSDGH